MDYYNYLLLNENLIHKNPRIGRDMKVVFIPDTLRISPGSSTASRLFPPIICPIPLRSTHEKQKRHQ